MWTLTADDGTVIGFDGEALESDDPRFDVWLDGRTVAEYSPVGPWMPVPALDEPDAYLVALTFLGDIDAQVVHVEGNVPYVEDRLYPDGRDGIY